MYYQSLVGSVVYEAELDKVNHGSIPYNLDWEEFNAVSSDLLRIWINRSVKSDTGWFILKKKISICIIITIIIIKSMLLEFALDGITFSLYSLCSFFG